VTLSKYSKGGIAIVLRQSVHEMTAWLLKQTKGNYQAAIHRAKVESKKFPSGTMDRCYWEDIAMVLTQHKEDNLERKENDDQN
jgi:hypothetical protein